MEERKITTVCGRCKDAISDTTGLCGCDWVEPIDVDSVELNPNRADPDRVEYIPLTLAEMEQHMLQSMWPSRMPLHRAVLVPETWEGEASSPADALKPEGVQMPAGLLAEIICWLRVAADRTNLRHLGTRAITPHDRYAPVKQSELAKVLSKVDAALRQLGVTNVDMIIDRDAKTPVVSATDTREPLFTHKPTGEVVRLVHGPVINGELVHSENKGMIFRRDSGELTWVSADTWGRHFKRVV